MTADEIKIFHVSLAQFDSTLKAFTKIYLTIIMLIQFIRTATILSPPFWEQGAVPLILFTPTFNLLAVFLMHG